MPQNTLVMFGAVSVVGLLVMILGFKSNPRFRRGLETLGAVIFHVGVFGILYHKVPLTLFTSLVMLVLSLFVLIDPLKLALYIQPKAYRITGLFLLLGAVAFSTMYFTHFPVWLWVVPLVVYLLPYAIPPFRPRLWIFHSTSWVLILSYLGLIFYSVYGRFYPENHKAFFTGWFDRTILEENTTENQESIPVDSTASGLPKTENIVTRKPAPDQVPVPADLTGSSVEPPTVFNVPADTSLKSAQTAPSASQTPSSPAEPVLQGPFLQSLKQADAQYFKLKTDYESLKKKYQDLEQENLRLQKQIEEGSKGVTTM